MDIADDTVKLLYYYRNYYGTITMDIADDTVKLLYYYRNY